MPDVDAEAWRDDVVTAGGVVSTVQLYAASDYIEGLKSDGVWAKLNFNWPLYAEAAVTSAGAYIDFVVRHVATPVNAPTWTGKAGTTFNGSTQYLDLGTTGGTAQDSASFGFDLRTDKAAANAVEMGTSSATSAFMCNVSVKWGDDGNLYFAVNDGNGDSGRTGPTDTTGVYAMVRTASGSATVYKDGSSFGTNGQTSVGTPTHNYVLGAGRNTAGGVEFFSAAEFGMAYIGDGLTATDVANLTSRWNAYKAALDGVAIDIVPGVAEIAGAVLTVDVGSADIEVVPGSITIAGAVLEVENFAPVEPPPPNVELFDTFAPFGSLGGPGDPWVIGVGIDPLALDAHLGKDLLLIAEPLEAGAEGSVDLDLFPPFGSLPDGWSSAGAERRTLYVAATHGRSTANDDEPPAQYVPGRLLPFNFGARLFEGVDPLARGGINQGVIGLIDPDDELHDLAARVWDGTPLIIKRGARGTPFKDWPIVGRYRSAKLVRDLDQKQIQLRDNGWALSGSLHDETYAGTGGVEGSTDDIVGRVKPWAFGTCFNREPVLLSPTDQIWQWSLSSSQALLEFRHGGVPITIDADYADYAALAGATIPSGECATCLALSLVRANLTLEFGVRVDVIGDADVVDGHPAPLTRGAIARRIATARGQNRIDDDSEIDVSSFQRMEAYHSAPVGWYFDGEITKAAALDRVLAGILGWWRVRPDGRLTVGWVEAPELLAATITITGARDDVGKPRHVATAPPRRGTRISWRTNYSPQPERSSLAGSVSDADAALYARPASYAQALAPSVASTWPTAPLVTVDDAGFRDEGDAALEAARQQDIFMVERNRWARDLQIDPFIDLIGSGVGIADDPLEAGASSVQLCVAIEAIGTSIQTVEFFA